VYWKIKFLAICNYNLGTWKPGVIVGSPKTAFLGKWENFKMLMKLKTRWGVPKDATSVEAIAIW
jgi:hypothetical protein